MPDWRRSQVPGGTFFFTVVTDNRIPLFASADARKMLGQVLRECRRQWPFNLDGIVLLPDHLHVIWSLPRGDMNYSRRWAWLKSQFTQRWIAAGGQAQSVTSGRHRDGRKGVWQPKFWEHTLQDDEDFERHLNYIHYNPVKHGYVSSPRDWPWSSFHRYVKAGVYDADWGSGTSALVPDFLKMDSTIGE